MKIVAVVLLAVICTVFATSNGPDLSQFDHIKPKALADAEVEEMFEGFMAKHERFYVGAERQNRFEIFRTNVEKVRFLNAIHRDTTYGVTKFMDLSEAEFKSMYLMKPKSAEQLKKMLPKNTQFIKSYQSRKPMATTFDWREKDKNVVTAVKNQGACGSCWAFSATGNMEGQQALKYKKPVSLSEQQLVDCDKNCVEYQGEKVCDAGCGGGLMWAAFDYTAKNGGIMTEESYPYQGYETGSCKFKNTTIGAKVSGYKMLTAENDTALAQWLTDNGPVAIALNAEWLQFYFGGISDPFWCSKDALDHGVLLVGYGKGKTLFGFEVNYWIVKNSWSSGWGESGYFRIAWGKCGINTFPSTAIIA